ncbi:porin family protein [Nonlabens sp.]|mgnify:CR=1 FL=1|uniref:porin family protein n=1 Tax=Nonlabens sp. TaxID=1888209 RepID=UPI003F6A25E8
MKKLILLVALIAMPLLSYAQSPVNYGFRIGMNYSSLEGDDIDLDNRFGFHANFFADIQLNNTFSLSPEIGLSALGAKADDIELESGDYVEIKTNWLQVGLLTKINLGEKLFLKLGPQVGVNVGQKDNNDYYNYDFAAVGGLGYNFSQNFSVDVRYGYGLSNVFDRAFGENNEANNRYFQLGVAYKM